MLVYSPHCTIRLTYTLDFIASVLSIQITSTDDWVQFTQSPMVVKMVYGNPTTEAPYYRIQPQGILASTDIGPIDLKMAKCRELPCFFSSENDHHGFDVLGAIFFLLSRYEEYLPHELDSYGRYTYTNSIAYQQHFLDQPLVNFFIIDWVQQLQQWYRLEGATKELPEITPSIQWIPTYDIDIAFAYHHQPLVKNIGGFFKQLLLGNWENVLERALVYAGKAEDPFDVYGWLHQLHKDFRLQPHYFFLVAKDKGQYDKNITPSTWGMRQLIWHHNQHTKIGIHPSWKSGDKHALLQQEINTLQQITQRPCSSSRQHYIRLQMPETYRRLIACGITDDYSMGYGSINGFRASVASPFYWFDLEKNQSTDLLLHPFCFMDANAFFEQHQTAEEAGTSLQQYHDTVKQVGGQLITVFHNHFLTQQPAWQAWRNMYEHFAVKNFGG